MEALKNIGTAKKSNSLLTPDEIKKTVCDYYNINVQQLVSSSRIASLKTPRFIAIYLCRTMLNMTFEDIGLEFGNRDHSTIMNACIKIEKLMNEEQSYKLVINNFQQMLTK